MSAIETKPDATTPRHPVARALVPMAALALLWGCNWPILKLAIGEIPPLTFRMVTLVFAGLGLLALARASGDPIAIPRTWWPRLAVLAFFNITVQFAPFVGGIAMAMEEKVARGEIEPESVNDVKAALMGPLSGIGDSIFLSTLRVVAAAVGISLCQAGNPFGPIAFLLIYNVPGFALRIWGAVKGYELGVGFLDEAQRTGLMQKIMTCVGIVGVMVVGAMCKDMFWASIPVAIGSGEDAQTLQDILDGIMPGMLGMLAFWLYYWLLSKKINPMVLIVATMVVGIIGAFFGVLA